MESWVRGLDALCRAIEYRWPGVLAAHRGFATARMQPEDTDCLVEVFYVGEAVELEVIRATYSARRRLQRQLGGHVSIVCHASADTLRYYLADVMLMRATRPEALGLASPAPLLNSERGLPMIVSAGQVTPLSFAGTVRQPPYEIGANLWTMRPAA